jgi:ATF/CREB family transcription factor
MLPGPQSEGYFDSINRGFPTPNESSLRTGLTPGGGGSMFPAPSPNSQALFNSLQSGGATPGTLDFHRTAMNAAARSKNGTSFPQTSNPQEMPPNNSMDAQHDANDAANGLFMLAKGAQANSQFAIPNQTAQQMQTRNGDSRRANGSSDMSANGDNVESPENAGRASTRSTRSKKAIKAEATPNNRRKSEATQKGSNKKAKGNSGAVNVDPALEPPDDDDSEMDDNEDEMMEHKDTRKMTDEEKRRNFLERNRYVGFTREFRIITNKLQCRRIEMSATQEAMAGEPPGQSRNVLCRERDIESSGRPAPR